jgi:hypothetical protein
MQPSREAEATPQEIREQDRSSRLLRADRLAESERRLAAERTLGEAAAKRRTEEAAKHEAQRQRTSARVLAIDRRVLRNMAADRKVREEALADTVRGLGPCRPRLLLLWRSIEGRSGTAPLLSHIQCCCVAGYR